VNKFLLANSLIFIYKRIPSIIVFNIMFEANVSFPYQFNPSLFESTSVSYHQLTLIVTRILKCQINFALIHLNFSSFSLVSKAVWDQLIRLYPCLVRCIPYTQQCCSSPQVTDSLTEALLQFGDLLLKTPPSPAADTKYQ